MSDISKFYGGKTVLISGATGFMGKVLLERMLSTLPDVKKIYLLMRPKKGLTIQERIHFMLTRMPFTVNNISAEQFAKVSGIHVDFTKADMALSEEDKETIINEVSVVIHMAANVRFDLNLKNALTQNTLATKTLLEFCTKIKELSSVVYVSTTYCNIDIAHCEEKVYDIENLNVYKILDMLNSDNDEITKMTKEFIKPHPNTYTFSKRLAEIVARDLGNKLPLSIVRPSIVTPAQSKPIRGWVDTLNGPVGMLTAGGAAAWRVIYADGHSKPDLIPVDCAVHGIIAASWNRTLQKSTGTPVFNLTSPEKHKHIWVYATDMLTTICHKYPPKRILGYPRGFSTTNYFIYALVTIFCQVLPAVILDTLLILFQQKPFLVNVQKRLYDANKMMSFFVLTSFSFDVANTEKLFNSLSTQDQKIFTGINDVRFDYEYYKAAYLSTRTNCLKDDGKSSFRYVQLRIFYVIDTLLIMIFLYGTLFVTLSLFGATKFLKLSYWF